MDCPYGGTTADECAMFRERSVAGISDNIPDCPVHGRWHEHELCIGEHSWATWPDDLWLQQPHCITCGQSM